jgi:hypothetical protein
MIKFCREGHLERQIGTFGFCMPKLSLVGHFHLAGRGAVAAAGAVFVHIAGIDFHGDVIVAGWPSTFSTSARVNTLILGLSLIRRN